jgi:hypothetical protein
MKHDSKKRLKKFDECTQVKVCLFLKHSMDPFPVIFERYRDRIQTELVGDHYPDHEDTHQVLDAYFPRLVVIFPDPHPNLTFFQHFPSVLHGKRHHDWKYNICRSTSSGMEQKFHICQSSRKIFPVTRIVSLSKRDIV